MLYGTSVLWKVDAKVWAPSQICCFSITPQDHSTSDPTKPWFRFRFRRNPKVSVSVETQFPPKPKPNPKFLWFSAIFQTCRNQFEPLYIENCLKLLKIAYGLVENVLYCNIRCNYKVYRDWWNFIQKIVPIFLVKSFGFGFGFGFTETFGFWFRFRRNRKSGFVGSLTVWP